MQTVLSIDPASIKNMGVAILKMDENDISIVDRFTHVFKSELSNKEFRLVETKKLILDLIKKHNIDIILMELSMGFGKAFVRSQMIEIIGVIKLISCEKNIPVKEISPTRAKKLVTGYGRAKKKDMKKSIIQRFNIDKKSIGTEHEVDAIGIGLSYFIEITEKINLGN